MRLQKCGILNRISKVIVVMTVLFAVSVSGINVYANNSVVKPSAVKDNSAEKDVNKEDVNKENEETRLAFETAFVITSGATKDSEVTFESKRTIVGTAEKDTKITIIAYRYKEGYVPVVKDAVSVKDAGTEGEKSSSAETAKKMKSISIKDIGKLGIKEKITIKETDDKVLEAETDAEAGRDDIHSESAADGGNSTGDDIEEAKDNDSEKAEDKAEEAPKEILYEIDPENMEFVKYEIIVGISGMFSKSIDLGLGENFIVITAEKNVDGSDDNVVKYAVIKRLDLDIKQKLDKNIFAPIK